MSRQANAYTGRRVHGRGRSKPAQRSMRLVSALVAMATAGFMAVVVGAGTAAADPVSAPVCAVAGTSLAGAVPADG